MTAAPLRVLMVDDDEEDFLLVRDMLADLKGNPVRVDWCSTYESARERLLTEPYDACLVDYRLGARTGLDLLHDVNSEKKTSTPFIMLTGFGDHEVDLRAMESGAADYLVKGQLSGPLLERSIRYAINRAQVLREIKEGEERVRHLFDAAFEGIMVLDTDGKILDANVTAAKIFAASPHALIGAGVHQFCPGQSGDTLVEAARAVKEKSFVGLGTRQDGSTVHLELSSKPYTYLGRPAVLVACHDISERVSMEAQILVQDRLASIGLLASSVAHEIGTPLGVMRGRAELLLLRASPDPAVVKNTEIIIGEIDRVSKLIRSLLNLARGEKATATGKVDARVVIDEVLELLGHELSKRHIQHEVNVPADTRVVAESSAFHQVVLNLLVNAMHAIDSEVKRGRVAGHAITIALDESDHRTCIHFTDTGCGISEANQKRLFQPFFTTKDIGVGTGLGLATCYRLLESWGGTIEVKSKEGEGSTFTLVLNRA